MSCGFGEINIPSSRAFWDDDGEDEFGRDVEEKTVNPLKLTFEPNQPTDALASDLFLCIEGLNVTTFVEQTLLKDGVKLCDIPAKGSALYWIADKRTLIAVLEEDLTSSGEVTSLLTPYANKSTNVITLSVKAKVDFKTDNVSGIRDEITFIRGINSKLPHIKPLKSPNFIVGAAAGVASWRYNQGFPVSSYVAYTDNVSLDRMAAQPLLQLLQELGLEPETTYTPKSKEDSHLYM